MYQIKAVNLFTYLVSFGTGIILSAILTNIQCPTDRKTLRATSSALESTNQKQNRCHVMDVWFQGGIGSHMFQYASALGVAKRTGHVLIMSPIDHKEHGWQSDPWEIFDSLPRPEGSGECKKFRWEKVHRYKSIIPPYVYDKVSEDLSIVSNELDMDIIMTGRLLSWKYFSNVETRGDSMFKFRSYLSEKALKILHDTTPVGKENAAKVGIHVQWPSEKALRYNPKRWEDHIKGYLKRAMQYFTNKLDDVVFVLCSQDVEKAREYLPEGFTVVDAGVNDPSAVDMAVLSKCDHLIITRGSFGWWSGWFNKGQVVYDLTFPDDLQNYFAITRDQIMNDYYPSDWIPL